jgi:SAM-dependent methyltransferase
MEPFGAASYGDAFADVYDDWYDELPGTDGCVETLAALAGRRPLLELGVGTGRLALPLAAQGVPVVGLDASTAMLTRLRAKPGAERVRLVCADMATPPFTGERFGVIVVAFNTFFNVGSRGDQQRCLAAAGRLLAPDGALVVETVVFPDTDEEVKGVDASIVELDRVVLTASRLDPTQRRVVGQHIEIDEHGVRLRPWLLHYLLPSELDDLAAAAGLAVQSRAEGWNGDPFTADSRHQVSVYRRR